MRLVGTIQFTIFVSQHAERNLFSFILLWQVIYQKKAKTSEKLKMAVFFASVVPSPLMNRFSSSTLDQSLIDYYPHCPARVFGRHFEKKSPLSDKPLKRWFGPAVFRQFKEVSLHGSVSESTIPLCSG